MRGLLARVRRTEKMVAATTSRAGSRMHLRSEDRSIDERENASHCICFEVEVRDDETDVSEFLITLVTLLSLIT
jgi:hypothetical protein